MNYPEAVTYLLEQLPMFQRVGAAAYRKDLHNIIRLCDILGNPQRDLKCIHVAGTNGKGSVTHIIASILQQQGYKTGVFVSPHYKDYRERIKIDGKYISRQFVTRFVGENIDKFKHINASFFEISTAMAFQYFKERKVDYAVIETGMGGRLDSTNIIQPILSVITNIGFDHTQFLGDTLPKIAAEKAGIIKPKVPVVIGEKQRETERVFRIHAEKACSPIFFASAGSAKKYSTDLQGSYQQKNIATALKAVDVLRTEAGVSISPKAIIGGLKHVIKNTAFMGRWMVVNKKPLTIFDSAHNAEGLAELKQGLKKLRYRNLHFVYGTVGDKDISKNLRTLPKDAIYYFCQARLPRAMDARELAEQAKINGLNGNSYKSVNQALKNAKLSAASQDLIVVSGSVFVVAEVL